MREIIDRHKNESGIIYCPSRREVDSISGQLNGAGYRTRPYHAGMPDYERRQNQDAFAEESIDTIVATVAGSGSVNGLAITDNIPADTSFVPGSITLGGSALTDAADADAGDYNGPRITVALGTVAGGQTRTVTFQTMID